MAPSYPSRFHPASPIVIDDWVNYAIPMSSSTDIRMKIAEVNDLLTAKTGASGETFTLRMKRAKHRFPRKIRQQAQIVSQAEALLENPRLSHTVSGARYDDAIRAVRQHLDGIDLADKRRGWWLGVLGGMAFNLLAAIILFIAALRLFDLI